jgi:DNA-directed RNA polymerase subunit omega
LINASILTEVYAMEEELSAKARVANSAKMAEVEAELSTTAIDESADEMSEVTKA